MKFRGGWLPWAPTTATAAPVGTRGRVGRNGYGHYAMGIARKKSQIEALNRSSSEHAVARFDALESAFKSLLCCAVLWRLLIGAGRARPGGPAQAQGRRCRPGPELSPPQHSTDSNTYRSVSRRSETARKEYLGVSMGIMVSRM